MPREAAIGSPNMMLPCSFLVYYIIIIIIIIIILIIIIIMSFLLSMMILAADLLMTCTTYSGHLVWFPMTHAR